MHLVPKNTFFREIFDDLFDLPAIKSIDIMRSDIYEEGNNYIIEVDIPGFKKKDIKIDYNKGYLNVNAQRKESTNKENEAKGKKYIRKERYYGEYKRSFYVGDIDESSIKANFDDGTLKVSFPKKQLENADKKLIEIE